jgi:hypothetical protein
MNWRVCTLNMVIHITTDLVCGPTKFAEFLQQVRRTAQASARTGSKTYYVVLILTDGQIDGKHHQLIGLN